MTFIISLFTEYLKPLLIGIASIIGIVFIAKTEDLKAQNQALNDSLEDENKTIQEQNAVIQAVNDTEPTDIAGITKLMRDNKL